MTEQLAYVTATELRQRLDARDISAYELVQQCIEH